VASTNFPGLSQRARRTDHPFTYTLLPGLETPTCILRQPLLAEVFGGGFDRPEGSTHFHLRWPRMSKWFRPGERDWRECCTTSAIDELGRHSQGLDRADKDLDDALNLIWDKPISQSIRAPILQEEQAAEWEARLTMADGHALSSKRKNDDDMLLSATSASAKRFRRPTLLPSNESEEIPLPTVASRTQNESHLLVKSHIVTAANAATTDFGCSVRDVWSDCLVWISRDWVGMDLFDAWSKIVPSQNQVHTLEALWQGCQSNDDALKENRSAWFSRGIAIFNTESSEGMRLTESVKDWAKSAGMHAANGYPTEAGPRISIWVIDAMRAQDPRLITSLQSLQKNVSWSIEHPKSALM